MSWRVWFEFVRHYLCERSRLPAPFKPRLSTLQGEAPFKPPWSHLQASSKASSPFKPSWSPLEDEAPFKPLEAPGLHSVALWTRHILGCAIQLHQCQIDIGEVVDWITDKFVVANKGDLAVLHNRNKMVNAFANTEWVSGSGGAIISRSVTSCAGMTACLVLLAQTRVGFLSGGRGKSFHQLPPQEQAALLTYPSR